MTKDQLRAEIKFDCQALEEDGIGSNPLTDYQLIEMEKRSERLLKNLRAYRHHVEPTARLECLECGADVGEPHKPECSLQPLNRGE